MKKLLFIFSSLVLFGCQQKECNNSDLNIRVIDMNDSIGADFLLDSLGSLPCADVTTYSLIANKYFQITNYEKSKMWCLKSIKESNTVDLNNYILVSDAFRFSNRYDSAIFYLNMALLLVSESDVIDESYLQFRLGQVYFENNEFELSLSCFELAVERTKNRPSHLIALSALHEWVYVNLYKLNRIEESCEYAKEYLPEAYLQSNCVRH